jgi:hypothetical protein
MKRLLYPDLTDLFIHFTFNRHLDRIRQFNQIKIMIISMTTIESRTIKLSGAD